MKGTCVVPFLYATQATLEKMGMGDACILNRHIDGFLSGTGCQPAPYIFIF
jgi:hypothetical protein